jgi:hypothetical protein
MAESRAKSAMSGKKSSKKRTGRKVREMHIKPGKSGGYLVRHDLEPQSKEDMMNAMQGGDSNTEDHSVPDLASMQSHIAEHMPEQDAGSEQVEPDQGGAMTAGGQ